jgi:tetratricopeptide (TPR) repeat protein
MIDIQSCNDPSENWPNSLANVSADEVPDLLEHAEKCQYHKTKLSGQFEQALRSAFRLAAGLSDDGRILQGAELDKAVAEHQRCMGQWQAVGKRDTTFDLVALYNGGRKIASSGSFHDYTYLKALYDLDPQAGLQIRARCNKNTDEEVLLGFYPLRGVRHEGGEVLRLSLGNGYTAGLKVRQISDRDFIVHFQCVEDAAAEGESLSALCQSGRTVRRRVFVLSESLRGECSEKVELMILRIRHLAKHQRYEEALALSRKATRLAPGYWRARINLGTMLVMCHKIDDGDETFRQVLEDCADNPKAAAAALHCRAWVKELKGYEVAREYEKALALDGSLADTRACLFFSLISDEASAYDGLLKDSVRREGFLDAFEFELDERATERGPEWRQKVLQMLPRWFGNLFPPAGATYIEEISY